MEEECHQLDLSVSENCTSSGSSFREYQQARSAVNALEEDQAVLRVELNQAQQILALLLLSSPQPQLDRRIQEIARYIHDHSNRIATNVRLAIDYTCTYTFIQDQSITQNKKVISKGFEREDGVFVKSLEMALKSFNVEIQAYHGGSFIGNHVLKALKVLK